MAEAWAEFEKVCTEMGAEELPPTASVCEVTHDTHPNFNPYDPS